MRGRLVAKEHKRRDLCEMGGSRIRQEWWIALCLFPAVGQTLRVKAVRANRPEDGLGVGRNSHPNIDLYQSRVGLVC